MLKVPGNNAGRVDWDKYDINKAREIAKKYGSAIIKKWEAKLHELDLVDRGDLLRSLKFSLKNDRFGFMLDRIQFSYEFYGKFFEHGASNVFGHGVELSPRKWRDEIIAEIKSDLYEEFGEYYASIILQEIVIEDVTLKM